MNSPIPVIFRFSGSGFLLFDDLRTGRLFIFGLLSFIDWRVSPTAGVLRILEMLADRFSIAATENENLILIC